MSNTKLSTTITFLSFLPVTFFAIWTEIDFESLSAYLREDGPFENASAALFLLSSISFIIFTYRNSLLKSKPASAYFMVTSWALLMFIFMGEEISWGQRIFNIPSPESFKNINIQNEINLHNMKFMDEYLGGKYRWLSVMMIMTGLLLPLLALSSRGNNLIQRFHFPVSPLEYAPLFIGAYLYGRYYTPLVGSSASEVREFLMALGMFAFAVTGAIFPHTLFREQPSP